MSSMTLAAPAATARPVEDLARESHRTTPEMIAEAYAKRLRDHAFAIIAGDDLVHPVVRKDLGALKQCADIDAVADDVFEALYENTLEAAVRAVNAFFPIWAYETEVSTRPGRHRVRLTRYEGYDSDAIGDENVYPASSTSVASALIAALFLALTDRVRELDIVATF